MNSIENNQYYNFFNQQKFNPQITHIIPQLELNKEVDFENDFKTSMKNQSKTFSKYLNTIKNSVSPISKSTNKKDLNQMRINSLIEKRRIKLHRQILLSEKGNK